MLIKKALCPMIVLLTLILVGKSHSLKCSTPPEIKNWWKRNFSINAGLGANLITYQAWGLPPRTRPSTWVINSNINIRIGQFNMPLGLIFSEQERKFLQPFNQYGISPGFKWLRFHAGYRSMTFSNYTLNGVVFLGGGIEINPGKLRFACMYGRLNRAVAEDTISTSQSFASFRRTGAGIKLGLGTSKSYLDLIYFQASDDQNSIPYIPIKNNLKPEENKVFGLNQRLGIGALFIENDAALSVYTRDLRDALTPIQTDFKILDNIGNWLKPKISTQFSTAFHSAVGVQLKRVQFRLQYKRLSPNYRSLGTYYIPGDMQQVTASPSFLLFKNKLRIAFSVGIQTDNVTRIKYNTTKRNIGAINISLTPNQNVITDIAINNFGTTQTPGLYPVVDSLKQYQVTSSINISQRFGKTTKTFSRNLMINIAYQSFTDYNTQSRIYLQNTVYTGSFNYNYSLLAKKMSIGAGFMGNKIIGEGFSAIQVGPTINLNKTFLKNKLNSSGGISLLHNTTNGSKQGFNFSLNSNLSYKIHKLQRISAGVFIIRTNRFAGSIEKFTELRFNLGYQFTF